MEKGVDKTMRTSTCKIIVIVSCLIFTGVAGCITSPGARFYILQSISRDNSEEQANVVDNDIALAIGPIQIPEYLNRPQIVTVPENNVVQLAEFDQWAEPLKNNITRVIIGNLSVLLGTDKIFVFPWKKKRPVKYQVEVKIFRLDGTLGGELYLSALWNIIDNKAETSLLTKRSDIVEPVNGIDYKSFVAAQNKALENLCIEIADKVKAFSEE